MKYTTDDGYLDFSKANVYFIVPVEFGTPVKHQFDGFGCLRLETNGIAIPFPDPKGKLEELLSSIPQSFPTDDLSLDPDAIAACEAIAAILNIPACEVKPYGEALVMLWGTHWLACENSD